MLDTQVGSESESYKKKEGCVKTKAEITVLGLQSKKHQGLIAGSHPEEVGERRGVASPQSLQRTRPTSALILDICPPSRITREYTSIAISHPCCGSYSSPGELIIHRGDGEPTILLESGQGVP